jgi:L-alanine-DL-glutamate epimerase-like enolase superfamily enzyme
MASYKKKFKNLNIGHYTNRSHMKITGIKVHILRSEVYHHSPPCFIRIFTDEGIEGNTIIEESIYGEELVRKFKVEKGWIKGKEFTKLIGADPLDRENIEKSLWTQYFYQRHYVAVSSALDECLWDIAGKFFKVPVYKLIGAYREKILAYASTQSYDNVEDYKKIVEDCVNRGFKAIKIHPPKNWKKDIELCKKVREWVGDEIILMHDPFNAYTREEAIRVGRILEKLDFYWFEDPIPTEDMDGLANLCRSLDIDIVMGEQIYNHQSYTELIRRGATDRLRCIDVNVGGITGILKVAHLAEAFNMKCEPHSWGNPWQQAAHLHVMLAIRNCDFFEMPVPQGIFDIGTRDVIRIDKEGYVHAPKKPGLGIDPDWDEIEKQTIKTISWPE